MWMCGSAVADGLSDGRAAGPGFKSSSDGATALARAVCMNGVSSSPSSSSSSSPRLRASAAHLSLRRQYPSYALAQ